MTTKYLAIDSECFYSKDFGIKTHGVHGYTTAPEFECYLISVVTDDGFEWRGHPDDCPWGTLCGYEWVSHNAGFDQAVIKRLMADGKAPSDIWPKRWHCSANMAVYFGLPRALGQAVEVLYQHKLEKSVRDVEIKGKYWREMGESLQQRVLEYALEDSRWCLRLWLDHQAEWPEVERKLSEHTYLMGDRGIQLDVEGIKADISVLEKVLFYNEARIPWAQDAAVLSAKQLAIKCREEGIEPPASLAQDSDECVAWENEHGAKFPWVAAMRSWRRANGLLAKYRTMLSRQVGGRMPYSLLYFGASTGRWSGSGGLNLQNLPRDPLFINPEWSVVEPDDSIRFDKKAMEAWLAPMKQVYMRGRITAAPGKTLIISDLSQIEPRVLALLAGDRKMLGLVRQGYAIYEAAARATMGWTGGNLKKENPQMYLLSKARCVKVGTKVLTSRGFISIEDVLIDDLIWDGVAFVSHEGVIYTGDKPTINVGLDGFTPEHRLYSAPEQSSPAGAGQTCAKLYRDASVNGWSEIWQLVRLLAHWSSLRLRDVLARSVSMRLRENGLGSVAKPAVR